MRKHPLHKLTWVCFLAAATIHLSACGDRGATPAPVMSLGTHVDSIMGAATVQRGDTVWRIAQRYNLQVRDIIDANHFEPPYALSEGQRIKLPAALEHRVGTNDTLNRLSRMYAVPVSQLVSTNNLSSPYRLSIGQMIRIPSTQNRVADDMVVQQSLQRQVDKIEMESLDAPVTVVQSAPVPAPSAVRSTPLPETRDYKSVVSTWASAPASNTQVPARPLLPQTVQAHNIQQPIIAQSSARPGFVWPLRGQVISSYGPKDGGLYNDGINIAAPRGTPILAAADGVIAYVGDDLGSYGNLVLIRHGGGMTTAYAHMSSVSVRKGMAVRKGQTIGSVGTSGTVASSQLHFEIRKGSETIDPKKFLG